MLSFGVRRLSKWTNWRSGMQGLDQIVGASGTDMSALGARFGLSPEQTRVAMGQLMPAVAGGLQKRADAGDLHTVAAAGIGIEEPDTESGNNILGQIFGSKDVSRQVAGHAASQSGISSSVMKALLPIAAAMLAKHLGQSMGGGAGGPTGGGEGGLGGMLGSVFGGGQSGGGSGLPGALGGLLGGGNPLDAILGGKSVR
jgi:hypothetical protein